MIDIYFMVKFKKLVLGVIVIIWFDLGGVYLFFVIYFDCMEGVCNWLEGFCNFVMKEYVEEVLEVEEDKFKDMEKVFKDVCDVEEDIIEDIKEMEVEFVELKKRLGSVEKDVQMKVEVVNK